ncbi:hypothetical protein M8J77_000231 [Diaphorina citri]|nr:hypothetical protein M8J77_000231 [Diaphorina citri]
MKFVSLDVFEKVAAKFFEHCRKRLWMATPTATLVETRGLRPFKSSEEYLYAMKEDLAEWLNNLYAELHMNVANFMDRLDTGVTLCRYFEVKIQYIFELYCTDEPSKSLRVTGLGDSQPFRERTL